MPIVPISLVKIIAWRYQDGLSTEQQSTLDCLANASYQHTIHVLMIGVTIHGIVENVVPQHFVDDLA